MMQQESNPEKRFALLENVKQYQVKSEEQATDIEKYIEHLRQKYTEAKFKFNREENNMKVETWQKKLKRLGDILRKEAYRIATHFPDHFMTIIDELILLAKQHMNTLTIQLIMNFLSPEVRCQSSLQQYSHDESPKSHDNQASNPYNIPSQVIALPPQQQSIIALPYTTNSLVISNSNPSDITGQQLRQQGQRYFDQDDLRVGEYLDKQFITVNRKGISDIFMHCAERIVAKFIQPSLVNDEMIYKLTVDQLISCLKLVCHISPSLYTYYLLSLLKSFSETILECFSYMDPKNNQKVHLQKSVLEIELQNKIKKGQYEQIVYLIKSLAQRWTEHKGEFNVKIWEWKVEQCMILTFLSSTVSEKQLYSIKSLIDRIRKTQYNSYSVVNEQSLLEFIQSHSLIQKIFHPQNHPQIIIKGKQVFEFVVKNINLTKQMIDIIFQLIIKSNESLGKGLYQTLYSVGHQNLQVNRQYILSRINSLPRASLFYEQTFNLIQALILFSPLENLRQSLQYTCMIIRGHYMALKAQTQHKLLNIYFEVYLMGVQEGVFGESEDDVMICLKPFLQNKEYKNENQYQLVFLMIDRFLEKLKQQLPKKLGHKCKYILSTAIKLLLSKYKIHQQSRIDLTKIIIIDESKQRQFRKNQLQLTKQLLESSEKQQIVNMLPQKQLWQLIQQDSQFGRFLSVYSKESQQYLLQELLQKQNVIDGDVKNIIQVYYFMDQEMRETMFVKIFQLFLNIKDANIKKKLVEFVVKEGQFGGEYMQKLLGQEVMDDKRDMDAQQLVWRLMGKLMLIKQSLAHNDTLHGYGTTPPFKYLTNSYLIQIKVISMLDVLTPTTFQISQNHYNTLKDCLHLILPIVGKRQLTQISVKLDKNQKQVTLQQLNWRLNQLTVEKQLLITIQQGKQSTWYDQSLLINPKTNSLNQRIVNVLKQIFSHYTQSTQSSSNNENITTINTIKSKSSGRLSKNSACQIFAIATNVQYISQHDARILHLFNNYSQTGEYLTIQEWINFYYQSVLNNPQLVIDNLKNLGYGEVFCNVREVMEENVRYNMQSEEESISHNNRVRSYFANHQSIFIQLVKLSQHLQQMSKLTHNIKIIQQSLYLIVQLFKQLPTWKQLQQSVQQEFLTIDSNNQMSKQNIQQKKTQNFLIMYIKSSFIVHLVDDNKQVMKINEYVIRKVWKYCIKLSHILCIYLTEELQQVIDPLQLHCNEQLAIWTLQNIQKVLCGKVGLKGIQQLKVMLQKDISQLTPFQNGQLDDLQPFKCLKQSPYKSSTQLFIKQLSQLCAINTDLINTYCALILWQLMQQYEQEDQKKCLIKQKQFLMKLVSYNQVNLSMKDQKHYKNTKQQQLSQTSIDNQLQSISNKLVYLLIQNIQGIKLWFMTDLLEKIVEELAAENDWKTKKRCIGYFQTLSQMIILECDQSLLAQIYKQLLRILEFISKQKDQRDVQNPKYPKYDKKQERNIFEFQQKLTENILDCAKNVILNIQFMGLHNNNHLEVQSKANNFRRIITHCQSLLISHQLSPTSQSYCYQILSTTHHSCLSTTSFLQSILSTVEIKKNSKPNKPQNQSQCGIYNLGCICYINSVFQQLYHVEKFRKMVMSTVIRKENGEKWQKQERMQQQEQPYFKQFRRIFYQLAHSHRQFIIPQQFCNSYPTTTHPINIRQQHDADQFLNQLLDRLQKAYHFIYQIPKQQTIIKQLFQGTMNNVITCQNCHTNKINQEEFYVLSLEIKNMFTLKEGLDKMVEPEVICDYYCTVCEKKVGEIQKYRKFSSLPKILFIHFQRLVFDLQSFSKVKLQNPVNFAEQIDLSQYYYQSLLNDQQAKYRLLGFIVHFGNSQGGHYISLIKHNNQGKGVWRKYDDSRITKWFWKTGIHEKDNAYLLIYQRIQTEGYEQNHHNRMYNTNDLQASKQQQLIQQINIDNKQLNKQLTVTREQFCQFLIRELQKQQLTKYYKQSIMEQEELLLEIDIQLMLRCKLIWKYLEIVEQAKSIGVGSDPSVPMVRDHDLQRLARMFIQFNSLSESAQYFLNIIVQQQALKLLYKPGDKKLRQTYKWIIADVIVQWQRFRSAQHHQSSFLIPSLENQTIRKLLWQVENILSEVGKSPNKMDQYFEFLLIIIKLIPKVKQYFYQMNIVLKLVHFIMQKQSKLIKEIGHYYPLGTTGKKVQCFNVIIEIIGVYVVQYSEYIIVQDKKLIKCLGEENFQFYKKIYSQRYQNYHQLNTILTKCCHNNLTMTNKVINHLLIPNLNRFNHQDSYIIAYIDVQLMYMLLRMNDEEQWYRMYRILGIPMLRDVLDENTMIKKKGQRIVRYWNNAIIDSDQIMFPLLELLYNNRENINYFQLSAVICLLKLMTENDNICQYILSLPSPCFAYQNYLSWIRSYLLKSVIKQSSLLKLQKIDLKEWLDKIGRLLQKIDNKVTEESIYEKKQHSIGDWIERNSQYLFGEITTKLQTRLITIGIRVDTSIIEIPLTYTILKTCHVTNWIKYAKNVCDYVEIIQPHEQYEDPKVRRKRFQTLLKDKYCCQEKSDSTLLQIGFSGDNQQLLPYRGTQSMLKVSFSYPQYPYEVFISVQKLINSQCKLIIPCPQKCKQVLRSECKIQYNEVDKLLEQIISFQMVSRSRKHIIQKQIKEKNNQKEITQQKEYNKQEQKQQLQNKQTNVTNQVFQEVDAVIAMNDAFVQLTENKSQDVKKQEICIECPFCGYIAHQFASRCPGCNEEWGLYA